MKKVCAPAHEQTKFGERMPGISPLSKSQGRKRSKIDKVEVGKVVRRSRISITGQRLRPTDFVNLSVDEKIGAETEFDGEVDAGHWLRRFPMR